MVAFAGFFAPAVGVVSGVAPGQRGVAQALSGARTRERTPPQRDFSPAVSGRQKADVQKLTFNSQRSILNVQFSTFNSQRSKADVQKLTPSNPRSNPP